MRYVESLKRILELDFDLLIPCVATAGRPYHASVDRHEARRQIDATSAASETAIGIEPAARGLRYLIAPELDKCAARSRARQRAEPRMIGQ